jgi:hypothetical protein
MFHFSISFEPALGPTQAPIQWASVIKYMDNLTLLPISLLLTGDHEFVIECLNFKHYFIGFEIVMSGGYVYGFVVCAPCILQRTILLLKTNI